MKSTPAWAELIQLVPVISLAISFVVSGHVDLSRAAPLMALAAALTVPVHALLAWKGHRANPILVGAAAWLWIGALAFNLPVEPVARVLAELQATGLFLGALIVGVIATVASPAGYVGVDTDPGWVRRASVALLGLTVVAVAWAFVFRANVRLGGGLPFIALNVTRRVLILRFAPKG